MNTARRPYRLIVLLAAILLFIWAAGVAAGDITYGNYAVLLALGLAVAVAAAFR